MNIFKRLYDAIASEEEEKKESKDPITLIREEVQEVNTDDELDRIEEALDRLEDGKGEFGGQLSSDVVPSGHDSARTVIERINENGVLVPMDIDRVSSGNKLGNMRQQQHSLSSRENAIVRMEFEVSGL